MLIQCNFCKKENMRSGEKIKICVGFISSSNPKGKSLIDMTSKPT